MRIFLASMIAFSMTASVNAFATPCISSSKVLQTRKAFAIPSVVVLSSFHHDNNDDNECNNLDMTSPISSSSSSTLLSLETMSRMVLTILTVWTSQASMASAADAPDAPDWGIFAGRTGSLLHPIVMGTLLAFSISTAFLGFDWRRQRTIGDDISALKKQVPKLPEGAGASTFQEALELAKKQPISTEDEGEVHVSKMEYLQKGVELEQQIQALQDERKELSAKAPRDKHFAQGALLAFLGTAFAIVGPLNTFARAGKLFPGPHLYAGAGLVVLWALASSCVPSMIKGSDTARTIHIGANVAGIALFAWQLITGIPILQKVLENTTWP